MKTLRPHTGHRPRTLRAPTPPAGQAGCTDNPHRHFGAGPTETTPAGPPARHPLQGQVGALGPRRHNRPPASGHIAVAVE